MRLRARGASKRLLFNLFNLLLLSAAAIVLLLGFTVLSTTYWEAVAVETASILVSTVVAVTAVEWYLARTRRLSWLGTHTPLCQSILLHLLEFFRIASAYLPVTDFYEERMRPHFPRTPVGKLLGDVEALVDEVERIVADPKRSFDQSGLKQFCRATEDALYQIRVVYAPQIMLVSSDTTIPNALSRLNSASDEFLSACSPGSHPGGAREVQTTLLALMREAQQCVEEVLPYEQSKRV